MTTWPATCRGKLRTEAKGRGCLPLAGLQALTDWYSFLKRLVKNTQSKDKQTAKPVVLLASHLLSMTRLKLNRQPEKSAKLLTL